MMGFGCLISIFRTVASLILGILVFFGLLSFLLLGSVRDNLLSAEFYTDILSEKNDEGMDVYDRIYDDVLLDPNLRIPPVNSLAI